MLHLFNKVYLEIDDRVDINYDRIVISQEYGVPMLEALDRVAYGNLILAAKSISEVEGGITAILSHAKNSFLATNKTTIIYADRVSYIELAAQWLKNVLPNAGVTNAFNFMKAYLFKDEAFGAFRRASSTLVSHDTLSYDMFTAAYSQSNPGLVAFVDNVRHDISVEFLLATYLSLSHRSAQDELLLPQLAEARNALKKSIRPLVVKDLEKYLYELKEIVLVHMQRRELREAMGSTIEYDFSNFSDFINDPAPIVRTFFKQEIWGSSGLGTPSSNGLINFGAISDEDIENLREFTRIAGSIWEEENFYSFIKSDVIKLDFVPFLREDTLSNAALNAILNFELNSNHAAGSFYSIDVSTVNNYFVDFILGEFKNGNHESTATYAFQ